VIVIQAITDSDLGFFLGTIRPSAAKYARLQAEYHKPNGRRTVRAHRSNRPAKGSDQSPENTESL
jgi:hypothetical protein